MSDPADFRFAIVGEDETGPAFDNVNKRAKQTAAQAEKATKALGRHAEAVKRGLDRIMGPARQLAPELDRIGKPLERGLKFAQLLGAAFRGAGGSKSGGAFAAQAKAAGSLNAAATKAAGGLASVASEAATAGAAVTATDGAIGAATVGITGLGGAALATATGVGALGAAFVGAEVAAAKFISPFARRGQQLAQTAQSIDLATNKLQTFQGASELAGVSADATTSAIAELAAKAHRVQYGMGSAEDVTALRLANIKVPGRGEKLDVEAMTLQAADAIAAQKDAHSQATLANLLGVGGALPFFRQGRGAIEADRAQYAKSGDVYSASDLDKSKSESRALTAYDQAQRGALRTTAMKGVGFSQAGLDGATRAITVMTGGASEAGPALHRVAAAANEVIGVTPAAAAEPTYGGFMGADLAARAAASAARTPVAAPIGRPAGGAAMNGNSAAARAQQGIAFFEANGFSRAAAIGIVANLLGENDSLDPRRQQRSRNGGAGPGYGIAQWEPARQRKFREWSGKDIRQATLQDQFAFVLHEMTSGDFAGVGDRLRSATNPIAASDLVTNEYERPDPKNRAADLRRREGIARDLDRVTAGEVRGQITVKVEAPPSTRVIAQSSGPVGLKVQRSSDFLTSP